MHFNYVLFIFLFAIGKASSLIKEDSQLFKNEKPLCKDGDRINDYDNGNYGIVYYFWLLFIPIYYSTVTI